MEPKVDKASDELLRAQTLLWSHIFNYIDSMALKCAVELGIPDAIASCGRSVTIPDLISALSLSPSKTHHLRRLMRMLTHSGFFACSCGGSSGEDVYSLTPLSELLIPNKAGTCQSGFVRAVLHPIFVEPFGSMSRWFRGNEATPFYATHGCSFWDMTERDPNFNEVFNEGMASDAHFLMDLLLKECGDQLFRGLESLVDVGGGTGSAAMAIAEAFPEVKCSVLELPQVVDAIHDKGSIEFNAGDMFDYVPPANAVLLKWILHDWSDEECVKILRRCKEAIPSKEGGGKVIIIDLVVPENNNGQDWDSMTTQLYFDIMLMELCEGMERREEEWKKLFTEAGFTNYKITSVGLRSVIEAYP